MFFLASSNSQGSCKLADSDDPEIPPSAPRSDPNDYKIGYGKPPRHAQFAKGNSGFPPGRPKRPPGISIKEILDGDQRGKNGEVISRREAIVIAVVNEALRGDQKAFSKFMKLMHRSGLMRRETSTNPSVVFVPSRTPTPEELEDWKNNNFGLPGKRSTK
jgi:Family of unknown function (DUF5681)